MSLKWTFFKQLTLQGVVFAISLVSRILVNINRMLSNSIIKKFKSTKLKNIYIVVKVGIENAKHVFLSDSKMDKQ